MWMFLGMLLARVGMFASLLALEIEWVSALEILADLLMYVLYGDIAHELRVTFSRGNNCRAHIHKKMFTKWHRHQLHHLIAAMRMSLGMLLAMVGMFASSRLLNVQWVSV